MLTRVSHRVEPVVDMGFRALGRFLHIDGTMRATVISAQAFTSLIPFLVVTASLAPGDGDLGDHLVDQFNLSGAPATSVDTLFSSAGDGGSTVTWIGVVILLLSGLSFTRAVQQTYARAYEIELKGPKGAARGLAWFAFFALWLTTAVVARNVLTDATGPAVGLAAACVTGFVFWLVTPLVLVPGLDARRLLPGAVVTGLAVGVLSSFSQVWVPLLLKWSAGKYGLIGIAFSLQTWLLTYAFIVVAAAALGATITERTMGLTGEVASGG
jgi:membrane protein